MAKDEDKVKKDDVKDDADSEREETTDEESKAADKAEKDEATADSKDEAGDDPDEAGEDEATTDSKDEDEDEDEDEAAAAPRSDRVVGASPANAAEVHGEAYSEAEAVALSEDAHDELAHITPVSLLFKVWAALMVFTVLTVAASYIDFGGQTNLVVAMLIATAKASLVVVFFMHLRWDRRFHALTFLSGFLFVILFIGLALTDRAEYQPMIKAYQDAQAKVHGGVRLGPQP